MFMALRIFKWNTARAAARDTCDSNCSLSRMGSSVEASWSCGHPHRRKAWFRSSLLNRTDSYVLLFMISSTIIDYAFNNE